MDTKKISQFVNGRWDDSIIPELCEYIKIPNKSPAFDADWEKHGYMEDAVTLMEKWVREQPIKELGLHTARVALHPEVSVTVTANVAQSEEQAEAQLNRAEVADGAVPAAADNAGENADPAGEPVDGDAEAKEPESNSATGETLDDA